MTEVSARPPSLDTAVEERAARSHIVPARPEQPDRAWSPLIVLGLIVLVAVLADVLAPLDPNAARTSATSWRHPAREHPLGADSAGRDVLSRLLFATRYSVAGALLAVVIAALIGVTSGLDRRLLPEVVRDAVDLVVGIAAVAARHRRAARRPRRARAVAVDHHGHLRRHPLPGVLPARRTRRRAACATSCTSTPPGWPASATPASSAGTSCPWCGRRSSSRRRSCPASRSPSSPGWTSSASATRTIPTWGAMLPDAFSRMYQAPHRCCCGRARDRHHVDRAGAVRQRAARRAGARRRQAERGVGAAASPSGRTLERRAGGAPAPDDGSPGRCCSRSRDLVGRLRPARRHGQAGRQRRLADGPQGEVHGLIGESGSGKTQTAWSHPAACCPTAAASSAAPSSSTAKDLAHADRGAMRKIRGRRIAYIPQEPMSNLDPSFTIGSQLVEPMRVALGISAPRPRSGRWRCSPGSASPNPRADLRRLPARGLRRHGAARPHRRRGLLRARPDHRRRADDRAGRDRAGRDPRPAARAAGGARRGRADRHAQLRRRGRPVRPGVGDAERPDRRDGPARAIFAEPAAPVHPVAVRRDPRGRRSPRTARAPADRDAGTLEEGSAR